MSSKYDNIKMREAAPFAASMMESLRDLGYSTETAVADIIDNAIFARATKVSIDFLWNGVQSRIVISDDGLGMTEEQLVRAMRPGSQSPASERKNNDLGRFGLGLKTASLSQCRMLTVLSRKKTQKLSYWCWDLDYITAPDTEGWTILQKAEKDDLLKAGKMISGTVVIWDNLDRVIELDKEGYSEDDFYLVAEKVKRHIEMVFHRYLETGKLQIIFNGVAVRAWDPFLRGEIATQPLPDELLENGEIRIKSYILPHRSKLGEDIWSENEERGGWDSLQGFYVYRNERLLLAADWLGLIRKKPHYKLARIMIDLPNHFDHEWQIDIKKSRASPPLTLRHYLKAITMATVTQAEQVFRHRGKQVQRSLSGDFSFVWKEMVKDGRFFFRINQDHPFIASFVLKSADKKKDIQKLLRLIEQTVPGSSIIAKEHEYPDNMMRPFEMIPDTEITSLMKELSEGWKKQGLAGDLIKKKLLMTEPFSDYPQLIETLSYE
ncbi:ATP-binding protein [Belliella marina]|uniref:ATP-binding protein n=1 Tax=Belliella marina TaxID=1644146 RepID=A0ABW4VQY2_9BACT